MSITNVNQHNKIFEHFHYREFLVEITFTVAAFALTLFSLMAFCKVGALASLPDSHCYACCALFGAFIFVVSSSVKPAAIFYANRILAKRQVLENQANPQNRV